MIAASATTVNIYSMKGELIVSWRRASHRGEWLTNPAHLPDSYKQMSEWNATYFTRKAMTVGPNTVKVIEHILRSREHEVQTYRLCLGILNYTKKYSKLALEDCCKLAIETNHISYSFIKNSIAAVAEEIGTDYKKYQKKVRFYLNLDLLILDDFLLHTITDEREIKVLFEVMEKRSELSRCTIVCSQREPNSWASMILNDEVSANAILKRATKHYTVVIQPRN
jgi:hypothetical protein